MHEMALAEGILRVVLKAAGGRPVSRVRLEVGRLQMVVPDSLQFSFRLVAAGTPAAEATLDLQEVPAVLRCGKCGAESRLDLPAFNCGDCGASDIEVISGDELMIDAIALLDGTALGRQMVPVGEILQQHLNAMSEESYHV